MHRALALFALLSLCGMLLACAPQPSAKQAPPAASAFPHNPLDGPVTPRPIGESPSNPNLSCKTNADCTVKNVGNCCGYYPMCVNTQAKTDPKAVQAQCAKSGMAGVCGFPAITACTCVQGRCTGDSQARAL